MFAVIKTGGKQYKVAKDDVLTIEKLDGEPGSKITFEDVLMVDGKVGTPTVAGASVSAEILRQGRGEKILVFKKKRRHNYRRTNGHRQYLTTVRITDIAAAATKKKAAAKTEEAPAEAAADSKE